MSWHQRMKQDPALCSSCCILCNLKIVTQMLPQRTILYSHIYKAFNLCCVEAYARFTELKRLKIHPGNMTAERDAVSLLMTKSVSLQSYPHQNRNSFHRGLFFQRPVPSYYDWNFFQRLKVARRAYTMVSRVLVSLNTRRWNLVWAIIRTNGRNALQPGGSWMFARCRTNSANWRNYEEWVIPTHGRGMKKDCVWSHQIFFVL